MATLIKNHIEYFVGDAGCLGRSCLDLGPDVKRIFEEKGKEIYGRVHSHCRRMLQPGWPRELPAYDVELSEKRRLIGVRLGRS
jgi:hypothetical protein